MVFDIPGRPQKPALTPLLKQASPDEEAVGHIKAGLQHLSGNNLKGAIASFRTALGLSPRNAFALHNLGVAYLHTNQPRAVMAAAILFQSAILFQPKNEQFRISRITALHRLGRKAEAHRAALDAAQALGQTPKLKDAIARFRRDKIEPARAISMLKVVPRERLHQLDRLAERHEMAELEQRASLLAQQAPAVTRPWLHLYNLMMMQSRLHEAEACMHHVLALEPKSVDMPSTQANTYRSMGDSDAALELIRATLRRLGPDVRLYRRGAEIAVLGGAFADAIQFGRDGVKAFPDQPEAYTGLGGALSASRRDDEAREAFLKALELAPDDEHPYQAAMSFFDTLNDSDAMEALVARAEARGVSLSNRRTAHVIARLEARRNRHQDAYDRLIPHYDPQATDNVNRHIAMTIGRICDKLERHDEAFHAFTRGNRLAADFERGRGIIRAEEYTHRLDICDAWLDKVAEDESIHGASWDEPADAPVMGFIVGFPRSGTTLLDTILRSHPDVEVFEEKPLLSHVIVEQGRFNGLPQQTNRRDVAASFFATNRQPLRDIYFKQMESLSEYAPGEKRVNIDKLPLNLAYANHLKYMFPNGKFIFAQRDPLDSVLSCFMQDFDLNAPMMHFTDIVMAARLYDRVMRLWFKAVDILGIDPVVVQYERLIEDHESQVRPVLDRLGIPWDERVTNYIETARSRGRINTPSATQVIQPLYTTSRARWRRYREHLEPIIPILQPWREKLGYGPIDAD
ncbi:sulfotransferase [Maricaulis sp.]|uniref:sulfotransferase n=1 Tax=Maricaulis sp. TaxID=1486257 RepID=UPI00329A5860